MGSTVAASVACIHLFLYRGRKWILFLHLNLCHFDKNVSIFTPSTDTRRLILRLILCLVWIFSPKFIVFVAPHWPPLSPRTFPFICKCAKVSELWIQTNERRVEKALYETEGGCNIQPIKEHCKKRSSYHRINSAKQWKVYSLKVNVSLMRKLQRTFCTSRAWRNPFPLTTTWKDSEVALKLRDFHKILCHQYSDCKIE